jgi:plastocyanin domain-containing protein
VSTVVVNLAGLALIALIVWWFWLSRPGARSAASGGPIEIVVSDGVYAPARIEVAAGAPVVLRFRRKDASPCAEQVRFDALGIAEELPLGEAKDVTLTALAPGEYEFTCQMKMYRGTLVAR